MTYSSRWIMSLSGGIRSVIQLEILKSLELAIGLDIPIQDFFDLIIGTRFDPQSTIYVYFEVRYEDQG